MPVKQDTNIENKENTTPTLGVLGTNHQFWSKKKKLRNSRRKRNTKKNKTES